MMKIRDQGSGVRGKEKQTPLFREACELRERHFGHKVFLFGFLYISTYCRNNCEFCYYRACNSISPRYRKKEHQIMDSAVALAESGVHLIDLTMGEDPRFFDNSGDGFKDLIRWVKKIKELTRLPVMVSPGVVPEEILRRLKDAGADWYACYQETHNRELFKKLRPGQDFDLRLRAKQSARQIGLLTEDGILVGVGETSEDIEHSIQVMRQHGAAQVRAMNFVPQRGTPMENHPPPDPMLEPETIARLRLAFPDRLIPATLDVEGLDGLKRRLAAGANVVTSIVPPRQGLAGVARDSLDIDDARRTVASVLPVLEACGLQVASQNECINTLQKSQKKL